MSSSEFFMSWDRDFAGLPPIKLPDGSKLETLSDCRDYILALPKKEQKGWEPVVVELLKAAERDDGPWSFFARLMFSRTLHGVVGVGARPEKSDAKEAWKEKHKVRKVTER